MSETNTGGPAFPVSAGHEVYSSGMTLRDWFAGQVILAAWQSRNVGEYEGDTSDIAACAFQLADAMIAQSQKQEPHDV